MKLFCLIKKGTAAAIIIAAFCAALAAAMLISASAGKKSVQNAGDRVDFISKLGISVQKKDETEKTVQIPLDFPPVYEKYNKMQYEAGYNLSAYKGVKAKIYTYPALNAPGYYVNLIVYRKRIIGGDFSSAALDGEMLPLDEKEIQKCLKKVKK